MYVLERVVQFLYEIVQWWSGWWYTSGGQQEKVSCVEKVRRVVVGVFRESEFIMCVLERVMQFLMRYCCGGVANFF